MVNHTLVLLNNTVVPGNFLAGYGIGPEAAAYDSARGEVFVANEDSDNVSVINDTTNVVVATVPVGDSPRGIAYDSGTGEVFVTICESNEVNVINDTTNQVVARIPMGAGTCPWGVAYDGDQSTVFVTLYSTNQVAVFYDSNNTLGKVISVGSNPIGIGYVEPENEVLGIEHRIEQCQCARSSFLDGAEDRRRGSSAGCGRARR